MLLVESDRRPVPEARIDHAIDRMESVAPTKNVEYAGANGQTHDVLVLNERAERQGDVERADDFGQEVVLGEVVILGVHSPGEGGVRNVVPKLGAAPAIIIAADRAFD